MMRRCMRDSITSILRASLLLCSCLLLGACANVLRNPVPADAYTQVSVLGRHDLRIWGAQ
jgi:hypothetical protein